MRPSPLFFAVVAGCFASSVWAQPSNADSWNYKVELFGSFAHDRFYDGDDLWASGPGFGGGVGVRPFSGALRGLGFEAQAGRMLRREETSREEVDDPVIGRTVVTTFDSFRAQFVAANAVYHFRGRKSLQPYVSGGIALLAVDNLFTCEGCVFDVNPETGELIPVRSESRVDTSKASLSFGGGVKLAVHRRISIRPEISILQMAATGNRDNWTWLRVQVGAGFHF